MPRKETKDSRPQIWTDGGQHPPFVPRAFALASVRFARDQLHGALSYCSAAAEGLGAKVESGRWTLPPERLGRTGRYLPSAQTTALAIRGGAGMLSRAARVVLAEQEPPPAAEPVDMSRWETPAKQEAVKEDAPPTAPAKSNDIDLAAIRALITAVDAPPPPPYRHLAQSPLNSAPNPSARRNEWLAEKFALVLGYGLLVVSVPVGVALAAIAHLKGEDLRKVVSEE